MYKQLKRICYNLLLICLAGVLLSCNMNNEETIAEYNSEYVFDITYEWGKGTIGFEDFSTNEVCIAVIDSANYYDNPNVTNYSMFNLEQYDTDFHGSFVVATLSYLLPKANILSINVADSNGNITPESLADGIKYAAENECDVINISLGTTEHYNVIKDAVDEAIGKDCIIVAAAGNQSLSELDYPAKYPNVISVMSRNIDNIDDATNNISTTKRSFSAPGSIVFNNNYIFSGSSVSSIYVTAEIAYIIEKHSDITYDAIHDILVKSSVFETDYSYGMINHKRIMDSCDAEVK